VTTEATLRLLWRPRAIVREAILLLLVFIGLIPDLLAREPDEVFARIGGIA
jgi:hypothetical protein